MPQSEPASAPQDSPYAQIGGEEGVRRLVERFYDLMDLETAFAGIRKLHPSTLAGSREKLTLFLSGWLGGPQLYMQKHGHPMLRARHLPFSIGTAERDQWMACMVLAMEDIGLPAAVRAHLAQAFFGTADWMRNRAEPGDIKDQ